MPIYISNGKEYDIPDDKAELFEKKYPDANVSYDQEGKVYDVPVALKSKFLAKYPKAQPFSDKITEFTPALRQGADALYQGGKSATGEIANLLVSGSNRDYLKAQEQLKEMQDSGYSIDLNSFDPKRALKDYKNRKYEKDFADWKKIREERRKERENMGLIDSFKHWWDDPEMPVSPSDRSAIAYSRYKVGDEVQLGRAFNAIQEALQEANGDVDKAYEILGEKSKRETWGDKTSREARDAMKEFKETKGVSAWVGNMIPQMAGNVAALAASTNPYTRFLARPLASVNMAALSTSSAGSAMADARNYAEDTGVDVSEGDVVRSGVLSGAIEWGTEKIPYERYFGRANSYARRKLGKEVTDAISSNPEAKRELASVLKDAAKDLPSKLFSKESGKRLVGDVLVEGFSEFLAEGGGTLVPMIYANPEDYPTLMEILQNGWEGAKGGMFMGSILGGASSMVGHYSNRGRRKQQGKVVLADTGAGVVEVVGQLSGDRYVAIDGDGRPREISRDKVNDFQVVDFNEFDSFLKNQTEDNLKKAEETGRSLAEDVDASKKKSAKVEYEQLALQFSDEELDLLRSVEKPAEYIQTHEDEAEVLIPFFNAKMRYEGMIKQLRDDIEGEVQKSMDFIDSNTHPSGKMYSVELNDDDSTPVYILSGNIVLNEECMIDKDLSDGRFVVNNGGKMEMRSLKDIGKVVSVDDAIQLKDRSAEEIRGREAARVAEEIEGEEDAHGANDPYADLTVDDYISSMPEITDVGKEIAYNNEEDVVFKAKGKADLSIKYRNGEISAKDMLVNDVYGYNEAISEERAKEEADRLSEYWADRYPQYITKTKTEVVQQNESNIEDVETGDTGNDGIINEFADPNNHVEDETKEGKPSYPLTKDGKIDYNTLLEQDPNLFAEAWEKRSDPDKARATLERQSGSIGKKIEGLQAKLERETDLNKVSDIEDEIKVLEGNKKRVDEVITSRYGTEEGASMTRRAPEGLSEPEYYDWVSREGDIDDVMDAYSRLKEVKNPYSNLQEWQRQLIGKKVNADSYYRFGDRNNATRQIKTKWFSKEGKSLDVLAKELSEFGREVTERDIVDFITENPSNHVGSTSEEVDRLGQRFSELATGVAGMKIGKPDSPTGRLFMDLQKAKDANVSNEALQVMEERLREYERMQPPVKSLEDAIPEETEDEGARSEDIESYDKLLNEEVKSINDEASIDNDETKSYLSGEENIENNGREEQTSGGHNTGGGSVSGETGEPKGTGVHQRVSQGTDRGENEVHGILGEASEIVRGEKEAAGDVEPAEGYKGGQTKALKEFAGKKGVWIDDYSRLGDFLDKGGENEVYSKDDKVVYKLNNFEYAGDDLVNFFDRLEIHNDLFPDAAYKLIGFAENSEGEFSAVLEQPYVNVQREATGKRFLLICGIWVSRMTGMAISITISMRFLMLSLIMFSWERMDACIL